MSDELNAPVMAGEEVVNVIANAILLIATQDDTSVCRSRLDNLAEAVEAFAPGLIAKSRERLHGA